MTLGAADDRSTVSPVANGQQPANAQARQSFREGESVTVVSQLGRLERHDLRDIWASEAGSFTPWLARSENLMLLGEALDLTLELEAQEKPVGPFRADILCRDLDTGHWVLIENQLERTDHVHLGQLLTYASGLDAVTIIWIAAGSPRSTGQPSIG